MDETFTLTPGVSSNLEAHYSPAIELLPHRRYALALVELLIFHTIPNIDVGCNTLQISDTTKHCFSYWELRNSKH